MPCTQSAANGLARERGSRGIPLVGSCAASASTGPSDTYGRSPERETLARNERELWVLSYRPLYLENERISLCRTSGLWGLIGARSSIRSLCSTATVGGWVNELWTMMEPVSPGWRTGYGRCRRDHRSEEPSPSKCRGAPLFKGLASAASPAFPFTPTHPHRSGTLPRSP